MREVVKENDFKNLPDIDLKQVYNANVQWIEQ